MASFLETRTLSQAPALDCACASYMGKHRGLAFVAVGSSSFSYCPVSHPRITERDLTDSRNRAGSSCILEHEKTKATESKTPSKQPRILLARYRDSTCGFEMTWEPSLVKGVTNWLMPVTRLITTCQSHMSNFVFWNKPFASDCIVSSQLPLSNISVLIFVHVKCHPEFMN